MENKKEMTAPNVSVGADTEQPIRKNTTSSISENGGNIKSFEELQREMQLQSDPSYLQTISMNELLPCQHRHTALELYYPKRNGAVSGT